MIQKNDHARRRALTRLVTARIVSSILGLTLASSIASCGNSGPRNVFSLVNNTSSTVTVTECGGLAHGCIPASKSRLPPKGTYGSQPSSAAAGSPARVLRITGNGGQSRCVIVAPNPETVYVTDATAGQCG